MRHPQWMASSITIQEKPSDRVVKSANYKEFAFDCQNAVFNSENKKRTFTRHSERPLNRYASNMDKGVYKSTSICRPPSRQNTYKISPSSGADW